MNLDLGEVIRLVAGILNLVAAALDKNSSDKSDDD